MTATFECQICCSNFTYNLNPARKTRKTVYPCTCPRCSYVVCKTCQTTYAKGECASCHFEFSQSFIADILGSEFYKDIVVPTIIRELMVEQRVNLETVDVQAMVAWLKECEEIRKNSRFGQVQRFSVKPKATGKTISAKYPCPIGDCRGLVIGETCNVCNHICCVHCHEEIVTGGTTNSHVGHVCSEDAKLSIRDSKPCPKCYTPIHRIDGCNHMRCTNCGSRFDWVTLQLQESNSNPYISSELFGQNQQTTEVVGEEVGEDFCMFSNRFDRVPRDAVERYADESCASVGNDVFVPCPPDLLRLLYTVTSSVREHKIRLFNEETLITDLHARCHDLRVQFLMEKISERIWEQRVYFYHTQYKAHILHATIINLYLSATDGYQIEVRNAIQANVSNDVYTNILEKYEQLTMLCNQSFVEIHKDYSINSTHLYIRNVKDTEEMVLDDCGFYVEIQNQDHVSSSCVTVATSKDIVLYGYQKNQVEEFWDIFITSYFALNFSMLGAGKSFAGMYVYKYGIPHITQILQFLRGLIICPSSMTGKWKELIHEYGLVGIEVYSFNELSGQMGKTQRVGHLIRRADVMTPQGNVVTYRLTAQMRQYIREGLFLIIDEIQNIKNDSSAQTRACKELVCGIKGTGPGLTKSRALLISGSPIDKPVQTVQFFKTVGIMTHQELTQFDIGAFQRTRVPGVEVGPIGNIPTGLQEIRTYCENLSPRIAAAVQIQTKYKSPVEECYQYFLQVIKPCLSRSMVVVGNNFRVHKFNGMYNLIVPIPSTKAVIRKNPKISAKSLLEADANPCAKLLDQGISRLQKCMQSKGGDEEHMTSTQMFAAMQKALLMIETAKIPIMVKMCREKLTEIPLCKVVLACNYTQTITDVVRELKDEFNPLVLNGSVPSKKRQDVLRPFQEPNTERRLLIGNVHVLSSGIDLDDKDGAYPRVCFVSPNYSTIDLYQISYRFLRALDTKSDSEMYMIYVKNKTERHLLNAIATKGAVMKDVTEEQAELANILFPCDFVEYEHPLPQNAKVWNAESNAIFGRLASS